MTAAAALARAHAAGLALTVEDGRLRWRGPPPPGEVLAALRRHKGEVLALLAANDGLLILPPASPEQAEDERQDRAAIEAEGVRRVTVPAPAGMLAAWEAELASLLAAASTDRVADADKAAAYFAAEARRRLARVRHDPIAAGALIGFWRHVRAKNRPAQVEGFDNA